jgi:hypothetical protein
MLNFYSKIIYLEKYPNIYYLPMRSATYPEQSPPNIPPNGKSPLVNAHKLDIKIIQYIKFYI